MRTFIELELAPAADSQVLLRRLLEAGAKIDRFEMMQPSCIKSSSNASVPRASRRECPAMDKKILIVAKREYLERVRSRWFVIMTLLVPAVIAGFVVLMAYIARVATRRAWFGTSRFINATDTDLGQRVANALIADTTLGPIANDTIRPRVLNVSAADARATEQRVAAEVQIPNHIAGYLVISDSTIAGKSVRYAGRNASSVSDTDKLSVDGARGRHDDSAPA
jgi:ABC-type Na+ efflux pump permease subunit